jgi:RNA polymerase-binding transcription factor DksA
MKRRADKSGAPAAARDRRSGGTQPFIDPKWAWHYRCLITLRDRLARDTSAKLHEAAEPLEPHSLHAGDSATDEIDHDLALALLGAEQNVLNDVNDAITRIERGTYGICEATQVPIPAARLRVVPWCRYTCAVEERLERTGAVPRPRLPRVVSLRGSRPDIPVDGDLPREGTTEEPEPEPEETRTARIIRQVGSLAGPAAPDARASVTVEPGQGRKA